MLAYLEAKFPPNSISWCLFLQIFLGGMLPDPPRRCTPAALATEHPQLEVPSSSHGYINTVKWLPYTAIVQHIH